MKYVSLSVAAAVAAILAGCAGSGSSSGSGNPSLTGLRIEAVNPKNRNQLTDLDNLQVREDYLLQLVNYDSAGNRTVLKDVTWVATSDPRGNFGTLASNTGVYQLKGQESSSALYLRAYYGESQFVERSYLIRPQQVRLVGDVVDEVSGKGIDGVRLNFYALTPVNPDDPDAPRSEMEVGHVTTAHDGTFRASIPSSSIRYRIDTATVPDGYYLSFIANTVFPTYGEPTPSGYTPTYRVFDMEASCAPPVPDNLPRVGQVPLTISKRVSGVETIYKSIKLMPRSKYATQPDADPCYY